MNIRGNIKQKTANYNLLKVVTFNTRAKLIFPNCLLNTYLYYLKYELLLHYRLNNNKENKALLRAKL